MRPNPTQHLTRAPKRALAAESQIRCAGVVECFSSRAKVFGLVVGSCAMVACGIFCTRMHGLLPQLAGWIGVALFGLCLLAWTTRLLRHGPQVRIDDKGVDDRRLGAGVVPWREITSIYVGAVRSTKFLCVEVADPDAFLSRLGPWKRWLARRSMAMGFPTFTVSFVDLSPGLREVCAHLEAMGRMSDDVLHNKPQQLASGTPGARNPNAQEDQGRGSQSPARSSGAETLGRQTPR